jgi:glycosyltransferase involved in cell wall biosynthesis
VAPVTAPGPERLRIALTLGTSVGGIGVFVHDLAAEFAGRGHDVLVAGPQQTQDHFAFTATGAAFRPVRIAAAPHPVRDPIALRDLRRALTGYQIAHAHGVRAGALTGLALTGRPTGRVVTLHNAMLASGPKAVLLTGLERLAVRRNAIVLGASQDLVERARRLGARAARLGPVPAPPASPQRDRAQVRAELGLDDATRLVLAVGRLAPQKDYPSLLEAAASFGGARVTIAGDGPLRAELQARIDADGLNAVLLGHRSDVADLMAAADVFVLCSRWEARALVVQEAMRAGLPVVATAVGGTPELAGGAALLVPPGDPAALAQAVKQVLADPAEHARLRAAGVARAGALAGLPEVVDELCEIYAALVRR